MYDSRYSADNRVSETQIAIDAVVDEDLDDRPRDELIAALNNTPGASLVLLDGRRRRLHDASLTGLMRDANYTLCPTGDTPESERIYQALEAGSIPLLDHGIGQRDGFQGPAFANWSNFSAPIRFLSRGGDQDHFRERQDCPRATVRDPERRWAALRRWLVQWHGYGILRLSVDHARA